MTTPRPGQPGSGIPPWAIAVPKTPVGPIRVGDAERDEAITALGDHFAAGRLNRDELDERVDQAMQARYGQDLAPLFSDLPGNQPVPASPTVASGPAGRTGLGWQPGWQPGTQLRQPPRYVPLPLLLVWLGPLLIMTIITAAVVLSAPWIIWAFVWVLMISNLGRHRRFRHHRHQGS